MLCSLLTQDGVLILTCSNEVSTFAFCRASVDIIALSFDSTVKIDNLSAYFFSIRMNIILCMHSPFKFQTAAIKLQSESTDKIYQFMPSLKQLFCLQSVKTMLSQIASPIIFVNVTQSCHNGFLLMILIFSSFQC
jgi:hypothetical protein